MANSKIAVLGLGKMGEALVRGYLRRHGATNVVATTSSPATAAAKSKALGITVTNDNASAVRGAKLVILGVKPHYAEQVLKQVAPELKPGQIVVSVAWGLTIQQLTAWSGGHVACVRVLPNTPAIVGEGMNVLVWGPTVTAADQAEVKAFFEASGRSAEVPEAQCDAGAAISSCVPAYTYLIIDALADAGANAGLPKQLAKELAAQTILGAAKMVLQTGEDPNTLKAAVATPGGVTMEALNVLEAANLRATLNQALQATLEKGKKLASR